MWYKAPTLIRYQFTPIPNPFAPLSATAVEFPVKLSGTWVPTLFRTLVVSNGWISDYNTNVVCFYEYIELHSLLNISSLTGVGREVGPPHISSLGTHFLIHKKHTYYYADAWRAPTQVHNWLTRSCHVFFRHPPTSSIYVTCINSTLFFSIHI